MKSISKILLSICIFSYRTLSIINSLTSNITGQDAGLKSIVNAFSMWELNKKVGPSGPLVLAIVGPNGVGKSETGNVLM